MAKKKTEVKQVEIKGKSIGRNVILEIDGEKYSRAFKDKAQREKILADVAKFNTKNTETLKKALIKTMEAPAKTRDTKAKKEAKVAKAVQKAKTPRKKPEVTKASVKEDNIKEAKELLEKEGFNVSKTTPRPTRREY